MDLEGVDQELTAGQIAELPDYDHGNLDREGEARLRRLFDHGTGQAPEEETFDEDRFYGSRRQTGRTQAETARVAGLEPGGATAAGRQDRTITGELDRAVGTLEEEAVVPGRGARD